MVKLTFKEQIDSFIENGERLEDPFFYELEPTEQRFIPAHIYTFSSEPKDDSKIPTPDEWRDKKVKDDSKLDRPYYDTRPIGICLSDKNNVVTILNIKVMPTGAAQVILNMLWQTFNFAISRSYNKDNSFIDSSQDLYSIPEYAALKQFNDDEFALADLINKATGNKFNIRYAVNKYQKGRETKNPKLVPFHLVPRVALIKVFDGIQTRALNMESIISPFIKS